MLSLLKSTFFTFIFFGIAFSTAHAEINEVSLQVIPEFPRPNSTVTIQANSSGAPLDVATFTWYVNGKVFKKGKGLTSIDVPSGKIGVSTRVTADIIKQSSGSLSATTSFRPLDVSLVWKTDGYVPPFYKGKALETYGSDFTIVAVPEFFTTAGVRMDPKTLVYTWKKNGTIDPDQSGYGKSLYKERQTSFTRGEDEISVIVSTPSDDMSSGRTIKLIPRVAEILFYENSPLYGILYENALKNTFYLSSEELTIRSALFDISTAGVNTGRLPLDWTMNGLSVSDFENKKEITLRTSGTTGGQTVIELKAQHQDRLLQGGQASITILQ